MFWFGVLCGVGIGGVIIFIVVLGALKTISGEKTETTKQLFQYWESCNEYQREQVAVLKTIADRLPNG